MMCDTLVITVSPVHPGRGRRNNNEEGDKMKTDQIIVRVSPREKEIIRKAAEEKQMSMSEYILDLCRRDAEKR